MMMMLMYCVCLLLAWYSLFLNLLKESPLYGLLLYFLISIPVVASIVVCAAASVYFGFKGIVSYFFDALKDFTVEIEPGGVPIEAAFEGV
jgi:hypothetical protein